MKKVLLLLSLSALLISAVAASVSLREGYALKVDRPHELSVRNEQGQVVSLRPAQGRRFIQIHLRLAAGRSVGKYDYILRSSSNVALEFPCVLLGSSSLSEFRMQDWEAVAPGDFSVETASSVPVESLSGSLEVEEGSQVRLVFEVDPTQAHYQLMPRYSQGEAERIYKGIKPLEINLPQ